MVNPCKEVSSTGRKILNLNVPGRGVIFSACLPDSPWSRTQGGFVLFAHDRHAAEEEEEDDEKEDCGTTRHIRVIVVTFRPLPVPSPLSLLLLPNLGSLLFVAFRCKRSKYNQMYADIGTQVSYV